jgi:hypothetical protein
MRFYILILSAFLIFVSFESATTSRSIETMMKPNWNITSKNAINKGCWSKQGKCFGRCRITNKRCVKMLNYDEEVCGCSFCVFNATLNKCTGQCGSNLVTERCVSKVETPTQDSDCECASCRASMIEDDDSDLVPTCDKSTCLSPTNSCKAFKVRTNLQPESQLECMCLNP